MLKTNENEILGVMCKAMAACPVHKSYIFADLKTVLIPAIRHQQFRFIEGMDGQFGVITWGLLDEIARDKHIENRIPLSFDEWRSGHELWVISLIGHALQPKKVVPAISKAMGWQSARYIRKNKEGLVVKKVLIERSEYGFSLRVHRFDT